MVPTMTANIVIVHDGQYPWDDLPTLRLREDLGRGVWSY